MRRSTLEQNTILKSKYRFVVEDLPVANSVLSVGDVESDISAVDRPDKTKVTAGRTGGGETDVTVDFADDAARDAYINWHNLAIDRSGASADDNLSIKSDQINGPIVGVDPSYKRQAMIIYHRLYQSTKSPVKIRLIGCWAKKVSGPGVEMNSEDATELTITLCYDDIEFITD